MSRNTRHIIEAITGQIEDAITRGEHAEVARLIEELERAARRG